MYCVPLAHTIACLFAVHLSRLLGQLLSDVHVPAADRIQATWIGHASILLQMGGLCFLTDPVFAQRCSPLSFAGPKYVSQVISRLCLPACVSCCWYCAFCKLVGTVSPCVIRELTGADFCCRRLAQVPFQLDDERLPRIDFVLISHSHYDHLCLPSVRQLHQRFGDTVSW